MERITNAMRLLSSAKLNKAKATFEKTNENFHLTEHMIQEIFNDAVEDIPHKYLAGDWEIKRTCYIVITSNKGLCGGFNSAVIKEAERAMAADPSEPVVVAIGTRGRDYFARKGVEIFASYDAAPETISFLEARDACEPLIEAYDTDVFDRVVLIYNSFVSTLQQEVVQKTLLPLELATDPEFGHEQAKEVEYEPSVTEVFNYLVEKWVENMLYGAIVSSATSEHAARRAAMESATDNAREMLTDLNLSYNRARQAAITDEIIEVVSGSEAQG